MSGKLLITAIFAGIGFVSNAQFWDYSDPIRLGGEVNTEYEESIPVFSKDSSLLYFVRTYDPSNKGGVNDQDIWYSEKDETGNYTNCKRLKSLNNKFNNAVVGLGQDGTVMYLLNSYDGKKDMEKGIAYSQGGGTGWSSPEKIDVPELDIEGNFYGFHVNKAENVMFISYAGPGSLGEEDLYYSQVIDGAWSILIHMGNVINSAGFEISPFLSESQDTLFFSSNGFGGEGDADIFYSVKQGDWDKWSEPINLGPRINSPKFDAYFTHSGDQGYWSSNREADRADIYKIDIYTPPPISASCSATNATTYKGTDGSIDLMISGGAEPFTYAWSNGSSAEDAIGLGKGEYTVTITDAVGQTETATCFVDEPPMPIDPVVVTDYENFDFKHNFGYNKNKLSVKRGKLKKFVKSIEKQLKEGREKVTIKIESSASNVPTKSFGTNERLAEVRAENMKYDLVDHFEKKFKGKVNVVISKTTVAGPPYEDDSANKDKYWPFQYVSLKTE